MSKTHGKFVWYDVMTSDCKSAESFYGHVVGWTAKDSGMPNGGYTLFSMGETMVGGLMPIPPDACAPADIPGIGRFAVVADPHGATFILFRGTSDQAPLVAPGTPGHIGWHELHAGNGEAAFAFYSGLFGWTKAEAVDMGAMGVYQTFAINGGPAVGGMMTKMPQTPGPFWLYYFNVDAVDAAMGRVTDGGGQIIHGPMQVPGGSFIAHCLDPQGAIFAIVGPRR
jgi:predicted enzyme related to lactoylglutathione lyase